VLLQSLRWRCVECAIQHEWDVREEQHPLYVARTSNNRVIMKCDLCWCLVPQCEALQICRLGFPIATVLSTMRTSKESNRKMLIGNWLHLKLRFLSPEICKQSLELKSWKAKEKAVKANQLKTKTNRSEPKFRTELCSVLRLFAFYALIEYWVYLLSLVLV